MKQYLSKSSQVKRRGIYFLANDKVFNLAIAFLNSFRMHNQHIDLCLIPFNDESEKIIALKDIYNFSIYSNDEILDKCDDISIQFHGKQLGAYRKLAVWEGEYDEFAYIDLDTIVLESVDFVFEHLSDYSVFTSHSNSPGLVKWVWKPSIHQKDELSQSQIYYSANTGFFVSRRHVFTMEYIQSIVNSALKLKDDMVLFCMEQPFLNYLIVTSNVRYSSLTEMCVHDEALMVMHECWAGNKGGIVKEGKFHIPGAKDFFLLHWAGLWQESNGSLARIPYKKLWLYYRNLNSSLPLFPATL